MDLDTLIGATSCLIDDALAALLADQPLRRRGPVPQLSDAEVLTVEVVGACLGLAHDPAIDAAFRRHYGAWFPALRSIHRTTFARQAAKLWVVKARLWQAIVARAIPTSP